jgi:hypothetical protein
VSGTGCSARNDTMNASSASSPFDGHRR